MTLPLPPVVLSFYWDDPKKLACVAVIENGTKAEINSFVELLNQKVKKDQIWGVPRLIGEIRSLAENAFTFRIWCYDQSTIFRNEVL